MAGMFSFHTREAVRVKVKKCEGLLQPEYRKFSVDPQITSFEVLQSLLARAFDIKGEFTISYLTRDDNGQEAYLSLLSDWDLDAAFLSSSNPCLRLKVDLRPFEEGLEDWDIIAPVDFPFGQTHSKDRITIAGSILNHMERTISIVQKALNLVDGDTFLQQQQFKPMKRPMNDSEFHNFLDSDGRLVRPKELRITIYRGGLEPGLRKVVWKHILNVYPEGLSGAERIDYMKRLSKEYYRLRDVWQKAASSGPPPDEMQMITNMVRKDVLRTDRTHKFYAGSDDNKNVVSLFYILTTFALNHPSVSYCQGMSDLASPLLVTMKDEAHAYVCFCALMKRMKPNFLLDGRAMTTKFQHLTEALQTYDPEFYEYLQRHGADDLLFCYRWLLLELKREFAFDDALRMLEVLWSSLPPDPPSGELELFEVEFDPKRTVLSSASSCSSASLNSPKPKVQSKENPYTKVRAIRRQSSSSSGGSHRGTCRTSNSSTVSHKSVDNCDGCTLSETNASNATNNMMTSRPRPSPVKQPSFQDNDVPNELVPDYPSISTPISRELRIDLDGLNRQLPGRHNFFRHSSTIESEELESPNCNFHAKETRTQSQDEKAIVEEESLSSSCSVTSDSDEPSTGERIRKITSNVRKNRKKEKKNVEDCIKNHFVGSEAVMKSSEESDGDDDSSYLFHLNGEILENDDDDDDVVFDASLPDIRAHYKNPHLKGIVPIRLVRERSPRRRTSGDGSTTASDSENDHARRFCRNISEGYSTSEETYGSSQETVRKANTDSLASDSLAKDVSTDTRNFVDSGVATETAMTNSCEEALENIQYSTLIGNGSCSIESLSGRTPLLPPPSDFGGGNPFMIFLCLTLLIQHRDLVMKNRMDYNELAMHFDKMVRRHNVNRVLYQARVLFADYLKRDSWAESSSDGSTEFQDPNV